MPLLTTDRALLLRFRAGERDAFAQVYANYAPGLAEFLRCGFVIQSRGESVFFSGFRQAFELENAVQEVFARAFTERARLAYDGLRPFVNYLYAIARNYVVDEYRRRDAALKRFQPVDHDEEDELAAIADPAPAADPALVAEEREVEELLAKFLERCDEKLSRYYDLRYRDGLTQESVAAAMGLTRIQVRRIEARFRREILAHLKGEGYLDAYTGRPVALIASGTSMLLCLLLGGGYGL